MSVIISFVTQETGATRKCALLLTVGRAKVQVSFTFEYIALLSSISVTTYNLLLLLVKFF